jgi:hypothetical protein
LLGFSESTAAFTIMVVARKKVKKSHQLHLTRGDALGAASTLKP